MEYTRLPKEVPTKEYPTPGSMFICEDASLAVVTECSGSNNYNYSDMTTRVYYTILSHGEQSSMSVNSWRKRIHVEQAENLILREVH